MLLASNTIPSVNITTALSAISYAYPDNNSILAAARVDIGNINTGGLGGDYNVSLWVNGSEAIPEFGITVDPATTSFTTQSIPFQLIASDVIVVKVEGIAGDIAASVKVSITEVAVDFKGVKEAIIEAVEDGTIVPGPGVGGCGLVSLAEVTAFLRLGTLNGQDQTYYQMLIDEVVGAFKKLSHREYCYDTYEEYIDGNGTPEIVLRETPVWEILDLREDTGGNFGESVDAFGADTLLTSGSDYALKLDGFGRGTLPNFSESGIVVRLSNGRAYGNWPSVVSSGWLGGWPINSNLASPRRKSPGCVRVSYIGGYSPVPADIRSALCQAVARLRGTVLQGVSPASESTPEGFSYTLATGVEQAMQIGAVKSVLASYRRLPI